jgi:FtsP/CotA-like multicopper oxidase with cupredoxin domain
VTLAPGQRADVILDLTGRSVGTSLQLRSAAFPSTDVDRAGMMGGGMMGAAALPQGSPLLLATLTVARREPSVFRMPTRLVTFDDAWTRRAGERPRRVPLSFQFGAWQLGGRTFDMHEAAADETVPAGSTRIWELANVGGMMGMQMAHPIHLHGRQFRVLDRTGATPPTALHEGLVDAGWTDTVLVMPGETVRILVTFTQHPGLYLYHCHILEHEDMGMMRNFRVTAAEAVTGRR